MKKYFDINFEFSKDMMFETIQHIVSTNQKGYICATDGVILSTVNVNASYREIINNAIFSTCDSKWITKYIKWIYGKRYKQYNGSQIFKDIIHSKKYKMMFIGASKNVLDALRENLIVIDKNIQNMPFSELPFCNIEEFDYESIAQDINRYNPDIIWVSLGAPKQEFFMARLTPYLNRGVMIAVGAVFNFFSGTVKRAPQWMIDKNIEFLYRIKTEPRKQIMRCFFILSSLPSILYKEYRKKKKLP